MKQEKNTSKKQWCITLLMILFVMLTCLGGLFLQRTPTAAEVTSDTNFVDDQVIVTLTKRETRKFLDYSADDFQEIDAVSVEDLTASTVDWVEKQVRGIPTEEEMLVNVENFRRVLCITLATSGRSEVLEAVSRLEQKNGIESASPNYIYEEVLAAAADKVNDPCADQQWGLDDINVEDAWEVTTGSPQVIVGVIDSGISPNPDLRNRLYHYSDAYSFHRDFTKQDDVLEPNPDGQAEETPMDVFPLNNGHGTKVAGIIAAEGNNQTGITGVAQNVRLVSLKVTDSSRYSTTTRLFRAINYAQRRGIPILNISMVFDNIDAQLSTAVSSYGGLIVAAAGNDGKNIDSQKIYPGSYTNENIITVGAIDQGGSRSIWDEIHSSNYGAQSVDIYAPGTNILSTDNQNGYTYDNGTSFAAPFVTGVAALLKSVDPTLTASQIRDIILESADTVSISTPSGYQTVRKLNAGQALEMLEFYNLFGGGSGVELSPFEIYNETQFRNISAAHRPVLEQYEGIIEEINYCFRLQADITLTGDWQPFDYRFTGHFDGNGHSITYNMTLNSADLNKSRYQGLFGQIDYEGEVENLILRDCSITTDGEINVANSGAIGILSGLMYRSSCASSVQVIAPTINCNIVGADVGGLVGSIQESTVENCSVTRDFKGTDNEDEDVGRVTSYNGWMGGMAGYGNLSCFHGGSCNIILTKENYAEGDHIGPVTGSSESSGSVNTTGITINKVGSCIAAGTLITLADGSQVPVEELTGDEMLLVWNLFTGEFDTAPILFIDSDPEMTYEIINLTFSDGTTVKTIYEHGFWDYDLGEYVYLDKDAAQYIGHWFNKLTTDEDGEFASVRVQLTNVAITQELTTAYSPVTYGHFCYYVNGMLSMPGGIEGLFNIFEVDEDTMTYDAQAMAENIAQYGLFTYEEFAQFCPLSEEMFLACGGQYLKVALGKGLITEERLVALVERYGSFFD